MNASLHRIHRALHANPWLVRFTAVTRLSIALGFIPSGLKKVLGERFTSLPVSDPIGFFFESFYRNQLWYRSVGMLQVVAAVLLIFPRTAHIGALVFVPIIVNIWLITVGAHFSGTWVLTSLMLLANLWLLAWEYDRLEVLLRVRSAREPHGREPTLAWAAALAILAVAGYTVLFAINAGLVRTSIGAAGFAIAAALGAAFGVVAAWHARRIE
jgi:uncharacterized membrane protein YphA (DoxX/SURF4 family)